MTADPTRLAYWLFKDINKAIRDFEMIQDGDRIGVAVSGGKDSLSLLRLLDWRRKSVPEKYELVALHIIGDARGPECPTHPPLSEWLENSGYEFAVEPVIIPEDEHLPMNCQRCTRNRRRTLFQVFRQMGCNVIAFGHHADDLAQTTLLNLLFGARVETMSPRRDYFIGYRLRLPEKIAPGKYRLYLSIEDLNGNKTGQGKIEFEIMEKKAESGERKVESGRGRLSGSK